VERNFECAENHFRVLGDSECIGQDGLQSTRARSPRAVSEASPARKRESDWSGWARAFENKEDNLIEGMRGDATTLSPIAVPEEYHSLSVSHLDASSQDVAYLYSAYARDRKKGTSEASNFKDAVRQHKLIDQIFRTSEGFFR